MTLVQLEFVDIVSQSISTALEASVTSTHGGYSDTHLREFVGGLHVEVRYVHT